MYMLDSIHIYIHIYSHGQKNWDTPKIAVIFIYSTKYSSYEIELISLDSPVQELLTSTTGRTVGFLLQLQLQLK